MCKDNDIDVVVVNSPPPPRPQDLVCGSRQQQAVSHGTRTNQEPGTRSFKNTH